jgi:hypothetical protein
MPLRSLLDLNEVAELVLSFAKESRFSQQRYGLDHFASRRASLAASLVMTLF